MTSSAKIFAVTYFLGASMLMCLGVLMPGGSGLVAVFAKPGGLTAAEVIARAEGSIIFVRDGSWVALTESEDHEFIASLYRAGAGFVASSAVARLCAGWNGVLGGKTI